MTQPDATHRLRIAIPMFIIEIIVLVFGLGVMDYADRLPMWLVTPVSWVGVLSGLLLPFTAGFVAWRSFRSAVSVVFTAIGLGLLSCLAIALSFVLSNTRLNNTRVPGVMAGYWVTLLILSLLIALPGSVFFIVYGIRWMNRFLSEKEAQRGA